MFTSNPKSVSNARLLKSLDYDEAQEIASSGAKVLHPRCILPAKQYSIPVSVHATPTPDMEGTVITATGGDGVALARARGTRHGDDGVVARALDGHLLHGRHQGVPFN
jgi:diaminopimelate decarboxylase/aspartate kinase